MKVILSGFNIDVETIKELRFFIEKIARQFDEDSFYRLDPVAKRSLIRDLCEEAEELLERDNLTPETISAAYARISRNPKPVNELREIARQEVERARKSNANIIFGLGHSSVAEHAAFNFDIIGVSRLAVETIEHFRLASYTEKSQRYILFEKDYYVPDELKNSDLRVEYEKIIRLQNSTYHKLYESLRPYFFEKYSTLAENPKNHRRLEGLAKEDARYIISLATQTQLGMTVNARTLENMISKCGAHNLAEVREYANQLFKSTEGIAPSIIKYVEPTRYLSQKEKELTSFLSANFHSKESIPGQLQPVQLYDFTQDADDRILRIVLFHYGKWDLGRAQNQITGMPEEHKKAFWKLIFKDINSWESMLREFEFVDFTFQLIVSASCYGQLKRHRIAQIIPQSYNPDLGVTIPESIIEINLDSLFMEIIEKTNTFYRKLQTQYPLIAPYILTNAHRRRVLFKINLREFYHFSRLREDSHAQWDIRQTANKMREEVEKKIPYAGMLLGGKDQFENSTT